MNENANGGVPRVYDLGFDIVFYVYIIYPKYLTRTKQLIKLLFVRLQHDRATHTLKFILPFAFASLLMTRLRDFFEWIYHPVNLKPQQPMIMTIFFYIVDTFYQFLPNCQLISGRKQLSTIS